MKTQKYRFYKISNFKYQIILRRFLLDTTYEINYLINEVTNISDLDESMLNAIERIFDKASMIIKTLNENGC